eukprot:bmy_21180T0
MVPRSPKDWSRLQKAATQVLPPPTRYIDERSYVATERLWECGNQSLEEWFGEWLLYLITYRAKAWVTMDRESDEPGDRGRFSTRKPHTPLLEHCVSTVFGSKTFDLLTTKAAFPQGITLSILISITCHRCIIDMCVRLSCLFFLPQKEFSGAFMNPKSPSLTEFRRRRISEFGSACGWLLGIRCGLLFVRSMDLRLERLITDETIYSCFQPVRKKRNKYHINHPAAYSMSYVKYSYPQSLIDNVETSAALLAKVDAEGKIKYDAIVRQGQSKDKVIYSKYTDMVPKEVMNADDPDLQRPDEEAIKEKTEKTRKNPLAQKVAAAMPVQAAADKLAPAQYMRYTPYQRGAAFNSGAKQGVIRMVEMQKDPVEPPRLKINKKTPRGPPSPPAPVMHSPSRKMTVKEQQEWKIPPCISNWKNAKGYAVPLDKRLAADGRGLQTVHINENFAKLAEALYIADRKAREAVETRAQERKREKDGSKRKGET